MSSVLHGDQTSKTVCSAEKATKQDSPGVWTTEEWVSRKSDPRPSQPVGGRGRVRPVSTWNPGVLGPKYP